MTDARSMELRCHVLRDGLALCLACMSACFASPPSDSVVPPDASSPFDASFHQDHQDLEGGDEEADAADGMAGDAGQDARAQGEGEAGDAEAGVHLDAAVEAGEEDAGDVIDGGPDYPLWLSETGLYSDIELDLPAPEVRAFEPRFALWSDGASKRRWWRLPPGTQVDTSDMDAWVFPVGTKAWKEFRAQGVRVETRMLHKVSDERWVMIAYRWLPDQSDAEALPEGAVDALGTRHDIPSEAACVRCHGNTADALLGVGAIQLSHERAGDNLRRLSKANLLSDPALQDFRIPGGTAAEEALGYLHANCGHCHQPGTPAYLQILRRPPRTGGPILWERTDTLQSAELALGHASTVGRPNSVLPDLPIIAPGSPGRSELFIRMSQRGPGTLQMPPLGTEEVDESGLAKLRTWIESLDAPAP